MRPLLIACSGIALLAGCTSMDTAQLADRDICAGVADIGLSDVTITSATPVEAGLAWSEGERMFGAPTPVNKPFCRVAGTIEQDIAFELWLPTKSQWNGKFLGAGVGGAAGTFNFSDLPRGINRGYAAATTDTGHKASDPAWMLDAERRANYTHRANHLLAERSKQILASHYGSGPQYSYFVGCSGGGRQGLKEMQLYPADYDGILTGANGPQTPEMTVRRMWEMLERDAHPGLMSNEDWQFISDAGSKACDLADGLEDGLALDPRSCDFQVSSLQCKPGQSDQCLSAEQVAFASKLYAPLYDENGRKIDDGLLPGVIVSTGRSALAPATFGQAVRGQAEWNGEGFNLAQDLAAIDRVMPELRADTTDISAFRDRGGKVIQYTGWLDGAVAARMVMAYHEALTDRMGGREATDRFERFYMLPGVYHCAGGPGPDQIGGAGSDAPTVDARHDLLTALEDWVERGIAPQAMVASKVEDGRVTRTGLICPFPQHASYVSGNPFSAESFECVEPAS